VAFVRGGGGVGRDGPAPGVGGMWYACDAFTAGADAEADRLYAEVANERLMLGIVLGIAMINAVVRLVTCRRDRRSS